MNAVLKKLLIRTKKAVFSQQIGNNSSKLKGEGYDFVELREYEDGEDIRKIDWVISAKMQKTYVKVFFAQKELDINIVALLSGSVYFGTSKLKQDVIAEITATIGYICTAQGDSYSSYIANDTLQLNTKKTKKLLGVDRMVENIYKYNSLNKSIHYDNIINEIFKTIKKKSIIFLIGDFFDTANLNLNLLSKKHEVIAIIVRDKFEENPLAIGNVNLIDPTTNQHFNGNIDNKLISKYNKTIKENDLILYDNLKKFGIDFIKIYTDDNVQLKLSKLFR